jgi:hypothetical protein
MNRTVPTMSPELVNSSESSVLARHWGQTRVLLQQLLTGWVQAETLRAEVAASG